MWSILKLRRKYLLLLAIWQFQTITLLALSDTWHWIRARTYKNYSHESVRDNYSRLNRDVLFRYHDVDRIWQLLKGYVRNCANVLAPYRNIRIRTDVVPWITREITELLADRDNLFLDAYVNKEPDLLLRARELRTTAKKAVRNARADFIKPSFE